jgi:hypothetical protein
MCVLARSWKDMMDTGLIYVGYCKRQSKGQLSEGGWGKRWYKEGEKATSRGQAEKELPELAGALWEKN